MKRITYFIASSLFLLCCIHRLQAQFYFSYSVGSASANCDYLDVTITTKAVEAESKFLQQNRPFSTSKECENARASKMAPIRLSDGCSITVIVGPCIGIGGANNAGDGIGTGNGAGLSAPGSFFSTTPANEIRDWAEDNGELMRLIGGHGYTPQAVTWETGNDKFDNLLRADLGQLFRNPSSNSDKKNISSGYVFDDDFFLNRTFQSLGNASSYDFSWRNVDMANVNRYLAEVDRTNEPSAYDPDEYIEWIYDQFKRVTGIDIVPLLNRNPGGMTNDEKQALLDFNAFAISFIDIQVKQLNEEQVSQERKEVNMSILALSVGDENPPYLAQSDYVRINPNEANQEALPLAEKIDELSRNGSQTGFNVELFYNQQTGEYTIAFEGSGDINDWINNFQQGGGKNPAQFRLAAEVADLVNHYPDLKINVTGHSLGGGLASLVGVMSNPPRPTFTYNAEGVNDTILKAYGADVFRKAKSGDYQITAYHTSNDLLTNLQETSQSLIGNSNIGAKALGVSVDLGNVSSITGQAVGTAVGSVIGAATPLGPGIGSSIGTAVNAHLMEPITKRVIELNGKVSPMGQRIDSIKDYYNNSLGQFSNAALRAHEYTQFDYETH